ncbi:MAG: phosphoglycerate kinase, partial [candidate division NC10 bacterium]
MFKKLSIDEVELSNKRVLIRVDFNVPVKEGQVADDTRIRESLPTIRYAREQRARMILCSHLGRPKGKPSPAFSLRPVAEHLSQLLEAPVRTAEDCIGEEVHAAVKTLQPGEVLLLENLRFHSEEEKNAEEFARALAGLCDVYVNDAFGAAHRAHASTAGITRFVSVAACGFLLRKEIEHLGKLLTAPEHPFVAIMGGAKVSDKIGVLKNL